MIDIIHAFQPSVVQPVFPVSSLSKIPFKRRIGCYCTQHPARVTLLHDRKVMIQCPACFLVIQPLAVRRVADKNSFFTGKRQILKSNTLKRNLILFQSGLYNMSAGKFEHVLIQIGPADIFYFFGIYCCIELVSDTPEINILKTSDGFHGKASV